MRSQDQTLELLEKLFDAKLEPIKQSQDRIEKAIYGNGKPGLMQRVLIVEQEQKNIIAKFTIFTGFCAIIFTSLFELGRDFVKKQLGL